MQDKMDMPGTPIKLKIGAPSVCIHCNMEPKTMQEEYGVGWMMFAEPNSTFIFFQCPHCNGIMGNIHAVENTKKLMQQNEQKKGEKIFGMPKSNLILPPGYSNN